LSEFNQKLNHAVQI